MDDDNDLFKDPLPNPVIVKKVDDDLMGSDLMGFSLGPVPTVQPAKNNNEDIFNFLDLGGGSPSPVTTTTQPAANLGMNFFSFDQPQPTVQAQNNNGLLGNDFMGFNLNSNPQPVNNNLGFSLNSNPVQNNNNFLGNTNFLGQPQTQLQTQPAQQKGILEYSNNQIEIWMECIKQSPDTAKIMATYVNKTQSHITDIIIQIAVVKHLILTMNPISSTSLAPLSDNVNQVIFNLIFRA
jgi:hypothetical protein